MSNNLIKKVQIFQRLNKLKLKAGIPLGEDTEGYVSPDDVARAQAIIDDQEENYTQEVEEVLIKMDSIWKDLLAGDPKLHKKYLDQIYNFANNIKDLAETYNYKLMQHFGASLRDFCEKVDVQSKEHQVIVQAHIDVMWVTYEQNMRTDDGSKAAELKEIVAKAIEMYS